MTAKSSPQPTAVVSGAARPVQVPANPETMVADRFSLGPEMDLCLRFPEPLIPTSLNDLFDYLLPQDQEDFLTLLVRTLRGEPVVKRDFIYLSRDNQRRWLNCHTLHQPRTGRVLLMIEDITASKRAQSRLHRQQQALLNLAKSSEILPRDQVLRQITEIAAEALSVERASIWLYRTDRSQMECANLYDALQQRHHQGARLNGNDYPHYFEALELQRVIPAHDALNDPRTREMAADYLVPENIAALLDATIHRNGTAVGVLCCEHIGHPRLWETDEQAFAGSVAEMVATVLERSDRQRVEQLLDRITQTTPLVIYGRDIQRDELLFINRDLVAELGFTGDEYEAAKADFVGTLFHPDDRGKTRAWEEALHALADDTTASHEFRVRNAAGQWRWLLSSNVVMDRDTDGAVQTIVGTLQDITDRKQAEIALQESEQRYRLLYENAHDGIFILRENVFVDCNNRALSLFRAEKSDLIGKTVAELSPPDQPEGESVALIERIIRDALAGKPQRFEWSGYALDGAPLDAEVSISLLPLAEGPFLLSIMRDISEKKNHIEQIEFQAQHDSLTGLPNRAALHDAINDKISYLNQPLPPFALLLIDLNRFKDINDSLGHHIGDEILKLCGPRLRPLLDEYDSQLFRLGGDEFAIVTATSPSRFYTLNFAEKVVAALKEPFRLHNVQLEIGASVGIGLFPEHGHTASELLRCADIAMYHCKGGADTCAIYHADMDNNSPQRLLLINELGQTLRNNGLELYYQPKVCSFSGALKGAEALLRWPHPKQGMIPPGQFIPLVEMTEMIRPLTLWVIEQALKQAKQWHDQGLPLPVAVNLSARNLLDPTLASALRVLLQRYNLAPSALELEITESALMSDRDRALALLQQMQQLGVRISIDDFGTGYSSLAYLKHLPLNTVKVDRAFTQHVQERPADAMIVRSVINLAHDMGLDVVGEGVEDAATWSLLREMGCDQIQGYYIAKPLPADALLQWHQQYVPPALG